MKIDLVMPKMGESLQEGTIIKWIKNVGDKVDQDETILEISTDKVDTEVPSPSDGTIIEILAQENETIEVGKTIAIIETEEIKSENIKVGDEGNKFLSSADLTDVIMPKMGESLQEGTIIKWIKNIGDKVEQDEMILEISTDKVDTEVPSPVDGTIIEILAKENEVIKVGEVIARIAKEGGEPVVEMPKRQDIIQEQEPIANRTKFDKAETIPHSKDGKFFSPLVRSIAEKENIALTDLESISGSGINGRITKSDILDYIKNRKTLQVNTHSEIIQKPQSQPILAPKKHIVLGPDTEIIPMDRVRQLIADHMVSSMQTSPHVTSIAEADVTGLTKFREKEKASFFTREGFKLTYTPFFAKAVIDGIKAYPMVNVSVDGRSIIRHRRINLGIATALDDGNLIVPVVKSAENLALSGLAHSIYDLSTKARTKKLSPDDIQGGTFSLTNIGTFGTLFGTPIINQPQAAIVAVGAIKKRPVVVEVDGNDMIAIRSMMYVSITYDHRVIDGMLAGQCLSKIVDSLENMSSETIQL